MADRIEFFDHPEYAARADDWQTWRDLYDGDRRVLAAAKYLTPLEIEGSRKPATNPFTGEPCTVGERIRALRVARAYYMNLFEPVVSTETGILFKKGLVVPKATRERLGDAIEDIDGRGNSLEAFVQNEVAVQYFRDGKTVVLADAPANTAANLAEQRAMGFRAFLEVLDILAVRDWQLYGAGPRKGQYEWLRYEFAEVALRSRPTEKPAMQNYARVLTLAGGAYVVETYLATEGQNRRVEWELVDTREVPGWDRLPVSACLSNESWVKDVAAPCLKHYNLDTNVSNLLNAQGIQRVWASGPNLKDWAGDINEYSVWLFPEGTTVGVVPPAEIAGQASERDAVADRIAKIAFNQARGLPSDSKEAPSGDTLREMAENLHGLLVQAARDIENVINPAVADLVRFMDGTTDFEPGITIDTDFTAADVKDGVERYLAFKDKMAKSPTWMKEFLKREAARDNFPEEVTQKIFEEIDAMKEDRPVDPTAGLRLAADALRKGPQPQQQQVVNGDGAGAGDPPK